MADSRLMHMQRILHLTLKRKWFDMIASGEKKEEYRDIKPYWVSRLVDGLFPEKEPNDFTFLWNGFLFSMLTAEHYDVVEFRNGYSKNAPTMQVEILDITDGFTTLKWADEYKPAFIIKLGKILSIKKYKNNNQ